MTWKEEIRLVFEELEQRRLSKRAKVVFLVEENKVIGLHCPNFSRSLFWGHSWNWKAWSLTYSEPFIEN